MILTTYKLEQCWVQTQCYIFYWISLTLILKKVYREVLWSDLFLQNNHGYRFDYLSTKAVLRLIQAFPIIQQGFLLPLLLLETPDRSSSTLQTVQKWFPTYSAPRDSRHILVDAPLSLLSPDCPEVILFLYVRGFYSSVYSPLTVIVNSLSEEDNGTVSSARFCRAPFTPGRYLSVL